MAYAARPPGLVPVPQPANEGLLGLGQYRRAMQLSGLLGSLGFDMGAGALPGAGIADAVGQMPLAGRGFEKSNSMGTNIGQGNYGEAALQGVGVLGDLMYLAGPLGIAAGAGLKSMAKAGRGADKVADAARSADKVSDGIRVYHGSPHDFDKFDMSKIGTGEGAQAYGHGLYFAEAEGVAKDYKRRLARGDSSMVRPDDVAAKKFGGEWARLSDEIAKADASNPRGFLIPGDEGYEAREALERARDDLHAKMVADTAERNPSLLEGRMYEARLNASPDEFLDWDKPLSEQPEKVRKAFAKAAAGDDPILGDLLDGSPESLKMLGLFDRSSGAQAYNTLSEKNREAFTQALRDQGIPGIRYLDQGSRGSGEGTYNYVVFDDQIIDILRKYGIAGLSMLGGGAALSASGGEAQAGGY